jgi:hypothetical protein
VHDRQLGAKARQALIAVTIRPPSRENIEGFRDWATGLPELVGVYGGSGFLLRVAVRRPTISTRS